MTQTQITAGDMVLYNGERGELKVIKVEGNRLTLTNPHTHSGRIYLPADKCQKV